MKLFRPSGRTAGFRRHLWSVPAGVAVLGAGVLGVPISGSPAGATSAVTVSTCNGSSPNSVANGSYLQPGGCLLSPNHEYELIMQNDGNLVLYYMSQSDPLWDSGTNGRGADYATLQSSGNLIVNATAGLFWQSGTSAPNATLVLQDDGNLVIYGTNGAGSPYAAWSTHTENLRGYGLQSGETLEPGQYLKSQNGTWTMSMAAAGYLVLSTTTSAASPYACPIWSEPAIVNYNLVGGSPTITTYQPQDLSFSYVNNAPAESFTLYGYVPTPPTYVGGATNASPTPNTYLDMQADGNLVLYAPTGFAPWATGTNPSTGAYAKLQTDGNFVVYSSTGSQLWSSGTNAYRGSTLCTDQTLQQGQFLGFSSSQNQPAVTLVMQNDCNLVLYETSPSGATTPIWASNTDKDVNGSLPSYIQGCYAVMQKDGNLVLYEPNNGNYVLWASGTDTSSPSTSTGHPFVGPFSLNLYNAYVLLQRWGTAPAWKADPENLITGVTVAPTLVAATIATDVISNINRALSGDVYNLQNALSDLGWL